MNGFIKLTPEIEEAVAAGMSDVGTFSQTQIEEALVATHHLGDLSIDRTLNAIGDPSDNPIKAWKNQLRITRIVRAFDKAWQKIADPHMFTGYLTPNGQGIYQGQDGAWYIIEVVGTVPTPRWLQPQQVKAVAEAHPLETIEVLGYEGKWTAVTNCLWTEGACYRLASANTTEERAEPDKFASMPDRLDITDKMDKFVRERVGYHAQQPRDIFYALMAQAYQETRTMSMVEMVSEEQGMQLPAKDPVVKGRHLTLVVSIAIREYLRSQEVGIQLLEEASQAHDISQDAASSEREGEEEIAEVHGEAAAIRIRFGNSQIEMSIVGLFLASFTVCMVSFLLVPVPALINLFVRVLEKR